VEGHADVSVKMFCTRHQIRILHTVRCVCEPIATAVSALS